jgi:hypothetical protein
MTPQFDKEYNDQLAVCPLCGSAAELSRDKVLAAGWDTDPKTKKSVRGKYSWNGNYYLRAGCTNLDCGIRSKDTGWSMYSTEDEFDLAFKLIKKRWNGGRKPYSERKMEDMEMKIEHGKPGRPTNNSRRRNS